MLKNMRIGRRLGLAFVTLLALTGVVAWVGYWGIGALENVIMDILHTDARLIQGVMAAHNDALDLRRYEKDTFLNIGDRAELGKKLDSWRESRRSLEGRFSDLETLAKTQGDGTVAQDLERLRAQRADLALFVRERLLALRALERSLTVYQQGLLPQGHLSVEAALASYQAGKVPFVTVLEAQSSLYGDRAAQLALLASHATLRAGLEEIQVEAGSLPVDEAAAAAGPRAAGPALSMGR